VSDHDRDCMLCKRPLSAHSHDAGDICDAYIDSKQQAIRSLRPIYAKPEPIRTLQCCVPVASPGHNPTWLQERYAKRDHALCQRDGVVIIDEKPYCKLHGGHVALQRWVNGEIG
jgi:hypothetical protein